MPKELDFDRLATDLEKGFSPEQREWIARLLHDHVSGLVTNIAMQVEIVNKMMAREMDITDELASLKAHVSDATQHIVQIERVMRPHRD